MRLSIAWAEGDEMIAAIYARKSTDRHQEDE